MNMSSVVEFENETSDTNKKRKTKKVS